MPTVSAANFEGDDLLSSRLLSFMTGTDQLPMGYEVNSTNGSKYVNAGNFGSVTDADISGSNNIRSPLHRNGVNSAATLHDRLFNGSSGDVITTAGSTGFASGSCTPPLSSVHPASTIPANYLPMRNHSGAPPYSALTSPCLNTKMNSGAGVQQLLGYTNCGVPTECHSLQNSPFYNHYPVNGNVPAQLHRQLGGISPGPIGPLIPNGVSPLTGNSRAGMYQDLAFPMNGNVRTLTPGSGGCPQRELFPTANQNGTQCGSSIFGSGLLMQDRLHYYALAQKHGFIVGAELERVKENSCRSTSQSYGRIAAHFRHRYGETEAKTKATYLQIGVRVPSKDHVSEIVGKGGQKIKLIREETGALITTPGEHEEHVFIIEAPPEIAMRVAHHLTARAQEITQSKLAAGERRRGSTSSQPSSGLESNGLSSNSFQNGNNLNASNLSVASSTNLFGLATSGASSTMMSLASSSATNSPLHPTVGVLSTSSVNGSVLRTPNAGIFSPQLSSLPASPCNSGTNNIGAQSNGGSGSLYLGSSTSGSRVLLARSRISVPQDMVGKIIGTQGSIITTIQKDTGTEIKSPPKEAARGPNATSEFEISAYQGLGLSSNQAAECRVQQAKQLIGHLVMRQLERRASEEVDETSGSPNFSTDEQRHGSNNNNNNCNGSSSTSKNCMASWMWPDVAQMDSQEAREVLDRILAESKNKTRRAKELAAATAGSNGPSPTGGCQNGSVLNMPGSLTAQTVGMLSSEQQLNNAGLFDPVDANECSDLSDMNSNGLFSPQGNRFVKRTSSTTLVNENGFTRIGAPCSPRTLTGFNLPDHNDLFTTFHGLPGSSNRTAEIWNPASNYNSSATSPFNNHNNRSNLNNPCDTIGSHPIQGYHLNSGSAFTNLFHSSPPALQCGNTDTSALRKQTSLTNGYAALRSGFDETSHVFNFSDSGNGLSSGFASGGDLSPTVLVHTAGRTQLQSDLVHQQLTRRHSDWVVSSSNMLMSDMPSSRNDRSTNSTGAGGLLPLETTCELNSNIYSHSNGFDFLKALDQLCLNSASDALPGEVGPHPHTTSASSHLPNPLGLMSHCPPGFESLPAGTETPFVPCLKQEDAADLHDLCATATATTLASGPWSNSNDSSTSVSLFLSSEHSPTESSHSMSKLSLLQRLFHNHNSNNSNTNIQPDDLVSRTTAHLSSIWSPSVDCQNRNNDLDQPLLSPPYQFTPYFDTANLLASVEESLVSKADAPPLFSGMGSSEASHNGGGEVSSSRCGAIGEGRRRRPSPSSLPNELDSVVPISVSSVITSITEVA